MQKKEYKNEKNWFHKYNNFSMNFFHRYFNVIRLQKTNIKLILLISPPLGAIFHNFTSVLYCFTSKSSYCGCCLHFVENG